MFAILNRRSQVMVIHGTGLVPWVFFVALIFRRNRKAVARKQQAVGGRRRRRCPVEGPAISSGLWLRNGWIRARLDHVTGCQHTPIGAMHAPSASQEPLMAG